MLNVLMIYIKSLRYVIVLLNYKHGVVNLTTN